MYPMECHCSDIEPNGRLVGRHARNPSHGQQRAGLSRFGKAVIAVRISRLLRLRAILSKGFRAGHAQYRAK